VPALSRWLAMLAATVVSLVIGLSVFNRYSRDVSEEL
jgi:hypothetical protein